MFELVNGIVLGSMYSLMALGLSIIWSITDIPDFSQGGIYVFTAYVGYFAATSANLPFFVALLVAAATGSAMAFTFEKLLYSRWRGSVLTQLLCAIALFFLLANLTNTIWTPKAKRMPTYISGRIDLLGSGMTFQRLMIPVVAVILFVAVYIFIEKSRIGKAIRAASQNIEVAKVVGINVDTVYSTVFALGGALSAIAAMMTAPVFSIFPEMGTLPLLKSLAVVVLAGFGSVGGVLAAGLTIGIVESFGGMYVSTAYQHGFAFLILIIVLAFRPQGLFGRKAA